MRVSPLGASPHPREQKLLAHILLERPVLVARQNQVSQLAAKRKLRIILMNQFLPRRSQGAGTGSYIYDCFTMGPTPYRTQPF